MRRLLSVVRQVREEVADVVRTLPVLTMANVPAGPV